MSSVDRRGFLKHVAAASAAVAGGAALGADALLAAPQPERARQEPAWRRAPCLLCPAGCGLLVAVRGGRLIGVKGDPDAPVNRGLACAKGYHAIHALQGEDRLTRALMRRDGRLLPVPLEQALDRVAEGIAETRARHGAAALAVYGSGRWSITDGYIAGKLFRGGLGSNNVETDVRLRGASGIAGLTTSYGVAGAVAGPDDIDHADVFILWNENLAETQPVLFARLLERRRRAPGVRIIDLATRTTRTAYAADRALLFAPGSDLALANGIAEQIVTRGRAARAFLAAHVALRKDAPGAPPATGFGGPGVSATWAEYVRLLADYTPERVARLTGLPAEDVRWLASLYGDPSLRVLTIWGEAANGHARGTWLNNLLHDLHLLTAKIATPGSGPFCTTGEPAGCGGAHDPGTLAHGLPGGSIENAADRRRAERLWGTPVDGIPAEPGHPTLALFRAVGRGEIRFLWVQGTDPVRGLPAAARHGRALARRAGLLVVSDAYPTATTELADVVLPSALWLEREGVWGGGDRRTRHTPALVAPPGDATADGWQLIEVARRLGLEGLFPWTAEGHVQAAWAEYRRFHEGGPGELPALAGLAGGTGMLWPAPRGRETRWRFNPAYDPAADPARGGFHFHGHADGRARLWLRPHEAAGEGPDAEYPYVLTTGAVLEHSGTGTLTRRIAALRRAVPAAYAELNRGDAERLRIRDGDRIRLISRRGRLEIAARIDHRSQPQPGQVFVPDFDDAHPVQRLTLDDCCPISGQPESGRCAVRIEVVRGGGAT
jgi:nitrate reductase (cytochrome)